MFVFISQERYKKYFIIWKKYSLYFFACCLQDTSAAQKVHLWFEPFKVLHHKHLHLAGMSSVSASTMSVSPAERQRDESAHCQELVNYGLNDQ